MQAAYKSVLIAVNQCFPLLSIVVINQCLLGYLLLFVIELCLVAVILVFDSRLQEHRVY